MRTASAPASWARSSSVGCFSAVTTRIATVRVIESRRSTSHSVKPSKIGSRVSVITSVGRWDSAWTSASRPSAAATTSKPARLSDSRYSNRVSSSASQPECGRCLGCRGKSSWWTHDPPQRRRRTDRPIRACPVSYPRMASKGHWKRKGDSTTVALRPSPSVLASGQQAQ
jgi:hypothetical protein